MRPAWDRQEALRAIMASVADEDDEKEIYEAEQNTDNDEEEEDDLDENEHDSDDDDAFRFGHECSANETRSEWTLLRLDLEWKHCQ